MDDRAWRHGATLVGRLDRRGGRLMIYANLVQQDPRWWCPWCGDHMGWGGGWVMGLFSVAVLALLGTLVWTMIRNTPPQAGPRQPLSAEDIVRQRYARGEIDEDTFRRMIDELRER